MLREFLKSKIHRASITEADLNYEGSLTIDENLMDAAEINKYERIDVYNITNGTRFSTYAIPGKRASGIIGLNGAAARLGSVGDLIIIASYVHLSEEQIANHEPILVLADETNRIKAINKVVV
jgi:aspartate 1-decarboxylase